MATLARHAEVVLVIDELRVISFDRFGMQMPSSVAFDDQVRSYLGFLRHFLMKQALLRQNFEMAQISELPIRYGNIANEERSSFFLQTSKTGTTAKKSPSKYE